MLSSLGLNKTHIILFLGRQYTLKCIWPIKVLITPYKLSISLVLCWRKICLEYYRGYLFFSIAQFAPFLLFYFDSINKHYIC